MIEDVLETAGGGWGLGLAVVAGGVLLLSRGARPGAKAALRGWFAGRDGVAGLSGRTGGVVGRAKALAANATESIQDLYAEARAEMKSASNA